MQFPRTEKEFKKAITPEIKEAATKVFVCMAAVDTIRPIVEAYQKESLNRHQFRIAREWVERGMEDRIILDPKESYLLKDADFAIYNSELFEARDKAGLKVENPEHCPLLVAEDHLRIAQHKLIDAMEPITGLSFDNIICSRNGLDNLKEYLDLILQMIAQYGNMEVAR